MHKHYFETKLVKMGKWKLFPLDWDTWYSNEGYFEFKKIFGVWKGPLVIFTLKDGYAHSYCPSSYFETLYRQIDLINSEDYKGLEKKLKNLYLLKKQAKEELAKTDLSKLNHLSNEDLAELYCRNRSIVHNITIFDQIGFWAEEYWTKKLEDVLVNLFKIEKGSEEYNKTIFSLSKPEEISTTLEEKRAVLDEVLKIKKGDTDITKASFKMSKMFGWMPVFCFGNAWDNLWYEKEISDLLKKDINILQREYFDLVNYTESRNSDIDKLVKKYSISKEVLQKFIDFGLALDVRNEAEYVVSFAGYYATPMIVEIAKRLGLSTDEVRFLDESEMVACLLGKSKAEILIESKKDIFGFGYNENMDTRINFSPSEAKELFEYFEKNVKNSQGEIEHKGVCASPGKVKGKAKIVHSPAQNNKVEDGDVLITHATTVDYLPAMKKAVAIVTEVGGLTCHAAVVSREFKIPCVVALKNAMKNFKDGDLVEVDADKGVVKILKKVDGN